MHTRIVVDDRETRCGMVEIFEALDSVSVTVKRLTCGDYEVDDKLLFERKTLLDLTTSVKDGCLFKQGCKLARQDKRGIIILEGTGNDLVSNGMAGKRSRARWLR